ncbi:MAG: sulfatase-like hydrolase/transferase, partial [Clostridia bacterium]|nr:sulfatase-like hydrolase/transferase [Clostridia bacterium]
SLHYAVEWVCHIMPNALKERFEVSSTKVSKIVGAVIFSVTMAALLLDIRAYTSQEFPQKWLLLAVTLLCPFILGAATAFHVTIKSEKANQIWHFVFLLLMPVLSITVTEALNGIFIYDMTYLGFLGNYLFVLILLFIVFALSGSFRLAYLIVNPVLYGFALAHSYIMEFRGTPFLPMDFLSISTAVGVANTYNFTPTCKIMTATMVFLFIMIIGAKTKTPRYRLTTKIVARSLTGAFAGTLLFLFYFTSVFAKAGVRPDFWNQTRGYRNYGFAFSFFCNTKYLYMSTPNNYNPDELHDYVSSMVDASQEKEPKKTDDSPKPNIICIMNESLSDLKTLGSLETNEDYMPFMRGLTKNTIKGNLYVPVIGSGTSNTEFEFLTGHTVSFLPSGSNAYMLYIKNPMASMVSTLKAQGYSSYALHPYYASGWHRTSVYNLLGFDKFTSLEDIMDVSLMQQYLENGSDADFLQQLVEERYPGKNMLVRQYISDSYNYRLLIEDFKKRDKSVPYFAFNVTMQNHGGYTNSCKNFDECIHATSVEGDYIKANKYLSLVKASDNAFKELITYFSNVKEPTVICMFGDHQPSVEPAFISEVMGVRDLSGLTIEQQQSRYVTPFIIWANYDIEEQQIERLSSNYLSSLVLKTAGVKLTEYNRYLLNLSKTLPVIDTTGYIDQDGNYYKWSDVSPYKNLLDEYEKIQYNNIFDQENVDSGIYYLDGYVATATQPEEDAE